MFTGIVREVGSVVAVTGGAEGVRLEIEAPRTAPLVDVGGSVAINGVCLTAETVDGDRLVFHAVPETLSRSTLGELGRGAPVNLEPALRAGDAMGGHIVQGHVDGIGTVQSVEAEGEGLRVIVEAAPDDAPLLRREGIDHRRRRLAHDRRAARRRVRRRADPAHARGDDARAARARAARQPRGRRAREVRRAPARARSRESRRSDVARRGTMSR